LTVYADTRIDAIDSSLAEVALTSEADIINNVCAQVVESYAEFYTIPTIYGQITERVQELGGTRYMVEVSFTKVLLAQSASELPYIQGLETAAAAIEDDVIRLETEAGINARKQELNDLYIGVEQKENATFSVFVPIATSRIRGSKPQIAFVDDFADEFVVLDMSEFSPKSQAELYQDGVAAVESMVRSSVGSQISLTKQPDVSIMAAKTNPSSATNYNRINARDYARNRSCTSGTSHICPKRNTNYAWFDGVNCANFVSQSINAGGISKESNWTGSATGTNTTTWVNTGRDQYGLTGYMVDQGFFFESTDKNKAFAGSIIFWTGYSHVGLVDQNDTVTMTYCANTNCQNSSSFKSISSVKFYVPVWDSYNGVYTLR